MRFLSTIVVAAVTILLWHGVVVADDSQPADALEVEHLKVALNDLDDADFDRREAATDFLSKQGLSAIPSLMEAAEKRSTEASVRIFFVLQKMYYGTDDSAIEAVDLALQRLRQCEKLEVAAKAVRAIDGVADIRQKRAMQQFERLGGIIRLQKTESDHPPQTRPAIDYLMLGPEWVGGNEGLQILARIEEIRQRPTPLYIIRGLDIADQTLLDLIAELPFLLINRRGPAKLGVSNRNTLRDGRCIIENIDRGSAADLAGLRAGDEVLEIGDQEVNSFEKLIEIIGEKEPGDRVPITIRRMGQEQTVEVVLSGWGKKTP